MKIRVGAIKKRCLNKKNETSEYVPEKVEKESSWEKFFWGSVQSDDDRRKENYIAGTLFHITGM